MVAKCAKRSIFVSPTWLQVRRAAAAGIAALRHEPCATFRLSLDVGGCGNAKERRAKPKERFLEPADAQITIKHAMESGQLLRLSATAERGHNVGGGSGHEHARAPCACIIVVSYSLRQRPHERVGLVHAYRADLTVLDDSTGRRRTPG
jgi:hypothetical protein